MDKNEVSAVIGFYGHAHAIPGGLSLDQPSRTLCGVPRNFWRPALGVDCPKCLAILERRWVSGRWDKPRVMG